MRIAHSDLERWKRNSISVAAERGMDREILGHLSAVKLSIRPGHSYPPRFFGTARTLFREVSGKMQKIPLEILVYETNPSARLPHAWREIYNQSGMDHELIGHLYNGAAGLRSGETAAFKRQMEFAYHRTEKYDSWKLAYFLIPMAVAYVAATKAIKRIRS